MGSNHSAVWQKIGVVDRICENPSGKLQAHCSWFRGTAKKWHETVDQLFARIKTRAKEVLGDDDLVEKMMPHLVCNLDEECLHALGKNAKVIGAKSKKKHDNQNASSRFVAGFFVVIS